jgi:hypothetical protein
MAADGIQLGSRKISQSVQGPFRAFAAFRVIETAMPFLFVGMATTT